MLVIVTIGFLIMFRVRINPQTVVTLENALPRIFLSLIFITLSYAIAGFMIDIMYLVMMVGVAVIGVGDPNINIIAEQSRYLTADAGELIGGMWGVTELDLPAAGWANGIIQSYLVGQALFAVLPDIIGSAIQLIGMGVSSVFFVDKLWPGFIKNLPAIFDNITVLTNSVGKLPSSLAAITVNGILLPVLIAGVFLWGGGIIMGLLVFLTLFVLFFRVFFLLFSSYIKILLFIIFAPLYIALGAIPGNNTFTSWLRLLAANLSVFPVTVFIILTGRALFTSIQTSSGSIWTPPFLYGIDSSPLAILVSVGMIYLLPDILRYVTTKISGSQQSPIKFGLGTFLGGAAAGAGGAGGLGYLLKQSAASRAVGLIPGGFFKSAIGKLRGKPVAGETEAAPDRPDLTGGT